jgi:hypothetical protein
VRGAEHGTALGIRCNRSGNGKACFRSESGSAAKSLKEPTPRGEPWGLVFGAPGGDLLSRGQSALASALRRFTVLFGMGRRGSTSLWPPSKTGNSESRETGNA